MISQPDEVFFGPLLKIERANRHIDDLNIQINAFIDSKPYKAVAKVHAQTQPGHIAWTAIVGRDIPNDWPAIIGDAVHNLRSALDLAVCEIVRSQGNSDNRIYFPTACDKNGLVLAIHQGLKNRANSETVRIIESLLEPYPGGRYEWLRTLHLLDIMDKHRLIVPIAYGLGFHSLPKTKSGRPVGLGNSFYVPVKDGAVFFDMASLNEFYVGQEQDVAFSIEFDEPVPMTKRRLIGSEPRKVGQG